MTRVNLQAAAIALAACHGAPPAVPTPPDLPPATTTCYAGMTLGMGQSSRTIARRTVDPKAGQIVEDVSHDAAGAHGAHDFHVVMAVDGDHFTMTEASNAFTGSGTLVGEPWRWADWTSTSQIPNTDIVVESADELGEGGLKTTKQIKRAGTVVATTSEELKPFDCARWDQVKTELAVPALDDAGCQRACRNFATLRFWDAHDGELAGLDAAARDEARRQKQVELDHQLDAGLAGCVSQCREAGNAAQTACMGAATSIAALAACDSN